MAKSATINLLPQEEFEASLLGRVLRWATGSFRIIVIITEMVVMGAFLSRFWLDAQNADLNDNLNILSAQVSAQKDTEDTFRSLQKRLDIYKIISASSQNSAKIGLIISRVPNEAILTSINIDSTGADIKGYSSSEIGIAQFISNLKAEKSFKTVDLGSVSSSLQNPGQTDFSIKISF